MTTIPGHNIVIQQSGTAQELTHQANVLKPSPEQAAAQQQINEQVQSTTVQEFDETARLKAKEEKDAQRRKKLEKERKKKKQQEKDQHPDTTGRLLDTIV